MKNNSTTKSMNNNSGHRKQYQRNFRNNNNSTNDQKKFNGNQTNSAKPKLLSKQERDQLRKENKYFNCKKVGHMSKDCKDKNKRISSVRAEVEYNEYQDPDSTILLTSNLQQLKRNSTRK